MKHCPYCETENIQTIVTTKDYFLTQEIFTIDKCNYCQLIFTNPWPNNEKIINYYKSDNYVSHGAKKTSLFDQLYLVVRTFALRWKLTIIKKITESGHVLDYGCGTGEFLYYLKQNGYQTSGVEPATKPREIANNKLTNSVYKTLDELHNHKFELITLWHVLEHVNNLKTTIQQLKEKLTIDGVILIAVPNCQSFDARYYNTHWAAYDTPRHLWHFTKTNIETVLNKEGLIIETVIPMKLDSYYVSILSEKYKNSNTLKTMVKSFITGIKSNKKASKSGEYSSLIYLVKRK